MLTENGKGYTVHYAISVLFFCKKSPLARHAIALFERTTSWRASKASETVLGMDNAKSDICYMYIMYVCMDGTHAN